MDAILRTQLESRLRAAIAAAIPRATADILAYLKRRLRPLRLVTTRQPSAVSRQVRSDSAGAMSSQTSPSIARSYVIAANATEKLKGAKQ